MREKILSEQIIPGTWYKTNGREDLIQAVQELISEKVGIELSEDLKLFRRLKTSETEKPKVNEPEKPFEDLFEWAEGREDCTTQLSRGQYNNYLQLWHNGKNIATKIIKK